MCDTILFMFDFLNKGLKNYSRNGTHCICLKMYKQKFKILKNCVFNIETYLFNTK